MTRLELKGNFWEGVINISDKGHGGLACDVASALRLICANASKPRSNKAFSFDER